MRWPIRLQLLLPMLSVVVLAVILVSIANAWVVAARARQQQEENIQRLSDTLAGATFPLTESVLRQMSGLSGAEFVLLDVRGQVQGSTLRLSPEERGRLSGVPVSRSRGDFSKNPVIPLASGSYLAERLPVVRQRTAARPGSLLVLYPEQRWWAAVRQAVSPVLAIGVVAAIVVALATTTLARRLVAGVRRLSNQTASIANGDFTPLAIGRRNDEIRDLAVSINQMTEKLGRYEEEVRGSERLRTLGQIGAGIAHQLRNSATGTLMAIELHQRSCPQGVDCESLQVAVRQLRLMESYLQRFLTLGRPGPSPRQEMLLEPLVREVLELVRPVCTHAGIDLRFGDFSQPLRVRGDCQSLRQLLVNLVLNAVEAVGRDGRPDARVVVRLERLGGHRAVVRVEDSGPGPAAATRERLFDPFVTEKPDGTGLGLAVARQVAEAHQGSIRWQRENGLTCFTVELPLLD